MSSADLLNTQEVVPLMTPTDSATTNSTEQASHDDISYVTFTKKPSRKQAQADDDEPLVDLTAKLTLHSKKTARQQKRQKAKEERIALKPNLASLPSELLLQILGCLRPSDLFRLQRVNHGIRTFLQRNETNIAQTVIRNRYSILFRCFPTPVAFEDVDPSVVPALISPRRQQMLKIHRLPYQHVQPCSFHQICTCLTCVLAWNNLCMVVDLAHWQHHLRNREPIPMLPRGENPIWNRKLVAANAEVVLKAMQSLLWHAAILEHHLDTTVSAISRTSKKNVQAITAPPRLYQLTDAEMNEETDSFLSRHGPASYEFPFNRDNYYSLEAYVTNRKWDKDEHRWRYFQDWKEQHMRDLTWTNSWYRGDDRGHHSTPNEGQQPGSSSFFKPVPDLLTFLNGSQARTHQI